MTSSKLILLFLGFIFLIIIIMSSKRIAGTLQSRFSKFLPGIRKSTEKISPSPTPNIRTEAPTPTIVYGKNKEQPINKGKSTTNGEIPATGPASLAYILMGGSLLTGISLKKLTRK